MALPIAEEIVNKMVRRAFGYCVCGHMKISHSTTGSKRCCYMEGFKVQPEPSTVPTFPCQCKSYTPE